MFKKSIEQTIGYLESKTKDFGVGCKKVYVSISGGVDSAVVVTFLCRVFGPENVVAMYRDIRSNPVHKRDVKELQEVLTFNLIDLDVNPFYDMFLDKCKEEFSKCGLPWYEENSRQAVKNGWDGAYASLKSRYTTPFAGFISKAIDGGGGRIFGTGNLEEDILLRYFDKFGDGAVDNNILAGLTKMEVRQIALWFARAYDAKIFERIANKKPSADLQANGDAHNDESELTAWAHNMGFDISLTYGDCEREGNIAWAVKQDLDLEVVRGSREELGESELVCELGYSQSQVQLILFVRAIEKATRHKELGIPGTRRLELRKKGLVD